MSKAVYVVYSRPSAPEREADFNDWYDHTHLGEVCAVPGVTGARRFRLQATAPAVGRCPSTSPSTRSTPTTRPRASPPSAKGSPTAPSR